MGIKVVRRTRVRSTVGATNEFMREMIARQVAGGVEAFQQLSPYDESNTDPAHLHMRDSAEVITIDKPNGGLSTAVILMADHAIFPEFGTVNMDSIPSFRPAMDSVSQGIRGEMKIVAGEERTSAR